MFASRASILLSLKTVIFILEDRRGTKRKLPFDREQIVRIDRIFYKFGNLLRLKIKKERMNRPVFDTDGRQDMKQLYLGQRSMMMASTSRLRTERVRMNNSSAMLDVDMYKQGYAAIVHNEDHR